MTKVTGSLRNLIQGVSQQPEINRLPGQCTEQINMSSNPVDGLIRRSAATEIANLFADATPAQFYDFTVNNTKYLLAATTGNLRVFNATTGAAKTVNQNNSSFAYLDGNPLAFTTSDDITYVGNRSKIVLMKSLSASYAAGQGIIEIVGGDYGKTYSVTITYSGGTYVASYNTPSGGNVNDIFNVDTSDIALHLYNAIVAVAGLTTFFNVTRVNNVINISSKDLSRWTMTVEDGANGINITGVTDSMKDSAKLPVYAVQGHNIKITGVGQNGNADTWYAVFNCNLKPDGSAYALGTGFGQQGTWNEVVAPGINFEILSTTMPHILTYDANTDQFTFDLAGFANRAAGDYITNPDPSFIGATIEDISLFQGRLVFLSGENIIMSRTNKPFDFWKNSATTLADTDPIDEKSTAKGVKKLYRAVPFNRDLIIFSNIGQFIVFGRNSITPKNSSLVLTTTFEANMAADPVAAGRNIFFAQTYGSFTGIREFYADGALDVNDARTITQTITKYLKGNVTLLSTSHNFDILFVHTDNDPTIIYPYEYIWVDNAKKQSSWCTWKFPLPVVFSSISQSTVTLVMKSGTTYILSQLNLDIQPDTGLTYQVKLDRKKVLSAINTTIANPYTTMPADPSTIIFVQGVGCPNPGLRVSVLSYNAGTNTYTLARDMLGGQVICGIPFRSSYIPTNPHVTDRDGANVGVGKLRVTKFLLTYANTGVINARATSPYRPDLTTRVIGRVVGDINSSIGNPAIINGQVNIPFRSDIRYAHLELWSDDITPMQVIELEWKGQYVVKGQRITNNKSMGGQY